MLKTLITATGCLLFFSCAGSVIKVMPEYSTMSVDKSKLGIVLMRENISINNPNDVGDDLGSGDPSKVFGDFFTGQFLPTAKTNSKFGEVFLIEDAQSAGFRTINQEVAQDETVNLRVPANNVISGESAPFVLVIDNISISRVKKAGTPMMAGGGGMGVGGGMMMGGSGGSDNLVLAGTFVLWDNTAGKIVSYGKIDEKAGVFLAMTKNTWIAMVNNISSKIFIGKPYGKAMQSSSGDSY